MARWSVCTAMTSEGKSVYVNVDLVVRISPSGEGSIVASADGTEIAVREKPDAILNSAISR